SPRFRCFDERARRRPKGCAGGGSRPRPAATSRRRRGCGRCPGRRFRRRGDPDRPDRRRGTAHRCPPTSARRRISRRRRCRCGRRRRRWRQRDGSVARADSFHDTVKCAIPRRRGGTVAGRRPRRDNSSPGGHSVEEMQGMSEQNQNTETAWRFHNATKYTHAATAEGDDDVLMGTPPNLGPSIGEQDPAIEPVPYKIYASPDPIPLPREPLATPVTALDAIAMTGDLPGQDAVPDLAALARLCLWSNGLLKRWTSPSGREIEFRAAGCTGARYHLELYFVCAQLPGLDAGVYQYAAYDHTLRRLRNGDYGALVVAATGTDPAVAAAPVIAICTSTFWRNAWRYQERAYRHVYWDAGTLLANVLAVAASEDLPARIVLGYAD